MYLLLTWTDKGLHWTETTDRAKALRHIEDKTKYQWSFYRIHNMLVEEVRG